MATNNSGALRSVAVALGLLALLLPARGSESASSRAERLYQEARQRCQKDPGNPESAWMFARACFDWAEFATNDAHRADLAERGIDICRHALALDANLGAAHYYLALNLGQLAR